LKGSEFHKIAFSKAKRYCHHNFDPTFHKTFSNAANSLAKIALSFEVIILVA